jgi:hypothetical protein
MFVVWTWRTSHRHERLQRHGDRLGGQVHRGSTRGVMTDFSGVNVTFGIPLADIAEALPW